MCALSGGNAHDGSSKEGIAIGFISSLTTAAHATVIKRSLPVVSGSTIHLAWYTNALSAVGLAPLVIVTGEIPLVWDILQDSDKLASLVIGTGITVSAISEPRVR